MMRKLVEVNMVEVDSILLLCYETKFVACYSIMPVGAEIDLTCYEVNFVVLTVLKCHMASVVLSLLALYGDVAFWNIEVSVL